MNIKYLFTENDLPSMASHCPQLECAPSEMYKGVLVQWDEDHDKRVLQVIDEMPDYARMACLAVQEHEGSISFLWADFVPAGYEDYDKGGKGIDVPDGDVWSVMDSKVFHGVFYE